MAVVC